MALLDQLDAAVRWLAFGGFVWSLAVAATLWAVRRGALHPFGPIPRAMRAMSDGAIKRLERMLVRAGGNPQDAGFWLVAVMVGAGLLLVTVEQWLVGIVVRLIALGHAGPRGLALGAAALLFDAVQLALLLRVIGSFIGLGPYNRWMRPAYILTDWLIDPIRRLLPAFGPFDFSPMVAYFLLNIARGALFRALL